MSSRKLCLTRSPEPCIVIRPHPASPVKKTVCVVRLIKGVGLTAKCRSTSCFHPYDFLIVVEMLRMILPRCCDDHGFLRKVRKSYVNHQVIFSVKLFIITGEMTGLSVVYKVKLNLL